MSLKPNYYKFKSKFKNRSFLKNSSYPDFFNGSIALILKNNLYINSRQILKLKIFFKKINKKQDKTKRYVLLKAFPHYPLSKKPQGLRMGKGTGKLNGWSAKCKSGNSLIEFRGIRLGRVKFYTNQFKFRSYLNTYFRVKKCD